MNRLEEYFITFRELASVLEADLPSEDTLPWSGLAEDWERLLLQTRLWAWQGSTGCDPQLSFAFKDLLSLSEYGSEDRMAQQMSVSLFFFFEQFD